MRRCTKAVPQKRIAGAINAPASPVKAFQLNHWINLSKGYARKEKGQHS